VAKPRGGYTCCAPGCYNNSKKDKTLSFHKFPKAEPYRTKWINAVKRKDFTPGESHHLCSVHFRNGNRMGMTDVPVHFPLLPTPSLRRPPTLQQAPAKKHKARFSKTTASSGSTINSSSTSSLSTGNSDTTTLMTSESTIEKLQQDIAELKIKLEALTAEKFCLQRFAGSDSDIRFYTGFPSYAILCSFYEFLGPAVNQLNYWGSDFKSEDQINVVQAEKSSLLMNYLLFCTDFAAIH